jgi:hypothetical protein
MEQRTVMSPAHQCDSASQDELLCAPGVDLGYFVMRHKMPEDAGPRQVSIRPKHEKGVDRPQCPLLFFRDIKQIAFHGVCELRHKHIARSLVLLGACNTQGGAKKNQTNDKLDCFHVVLLTFA